MFKLESELQSLVHLRPEIVLGGLPDISPSDCDDVPAAISLGREILLTRDPIDNLFIDASITRCSRFKTPCASAWMRISCPPQPWHASACKIDSGVRIGIKLEIC